MMKVWVTRDEAGDGPLSTALRAHGLEVVLEPVVERAVRAGARDRIAHLRAEDWLVLTSPFAVEAAACPAARVPRVAVVAESSRRKAEALGMRVELVSRGGDGESLFAELRAAATGCKVCYPRSSQAAPREPWPGVELISVVLYETRARDFDRDVTHRVDIVAVASPSAVRAVGAVKLPFASIGGTTSSAIRQLGCEPWVEAGEPKFEALAAAIAAHASDSRHHRA